MNIHRSVARARLHDLILRMIEVNAQSRFFLGIEHAYVVGSYVGDSPRMSGLEVRYTTYPKAQMEQLVRVAKSTSWKSGKGAGAMRHLVDWPSIDVQRFLRGSSCIYKLREEAASGGAEEKPPYRVIFANQRPVDDWQEL